MSPRPRRPRLPWEPDPEWYVKGGGAGNGPGLLVCVAIAVALGALGYALLRWFL